MIAEAGIPAGRAIAVAADVGDPAAVRALFDRIESLDALVNCAGIAGSNTLEGDDALWHAIVNSNLNGTYYCCKAAVPTACSALSTR